MVRETPALDAERTSAARQNPLHTAAATLTENSTLFLIHQARQQASTRPHRPSWGDRLRLWLARR